MASSAVFPEPVDPAGEPFRGWADWCSRSPSTEAAAARRTINSWYADFPPARGEMVRGRLTGPDDTNFLQAVDELHVHSLLSRSYEVRYEEDQKSPDFRLYRASELVASIEVCTLFPNKSISDEVARNDRLVTDINKRVRVEDWYVTIDSVTWSRQPRTTAIAGWLERTVAALPRPTSDHDQPRRVYASPEVAIEFTFLPRVRSAATEVNAVTGPAVVRFSDCERRLRDSLTKKAGKKYDHRDKPFAIFVSARERCDTDDFVNAIYGRRRYGLFALSNNGADGRNRRTGCVFGLLRAWDPDTPVTSTVLRFDNPFAAEAFPEEPIAPDRWLRARWGDSSVLMEWATADERR